jgi:hypothetical protein
MAVTFIIRWVFALSETLTKAICISYKLNKIFKINISVKYIKYQFIFVIFLSMLFSWVLMTCGCHLLRFSFCVEVHCINHIVVH